MAVAWLAQAALPILWSVVQPNLKATHGSIAVCATTEASAAVGIPLLPHASVTEFQRSSPEVVFKAMVRGHC